ncbi:MAG: signal peptidase II [Cyanobium sp. M30B3]|jgi:signal peptidase II|nr:MAG: signal peptidase II [Cyanobium sp. M30B3]
MSAPASAVAVRRRVCFSTAALVVLADQFSKAWATRALPGAGSQPLIPGLIDLYYTTNTGAAFSLFTGSTRVLGAVSLLVAVAVTWWILNSGRRGLPLSRALALGFLLGGAIGNGIDRWRLGAVIDFLALVPVNFPVFNIADVAINLAVLGFLVDVIQQQRASDG